MPHLIFIVFAFLLGAIVGSFLNVVVWRLPRGESLVSPPSRCPICLHRLAWYDNVPVLGWLKLRGRCRYCHTPISVQYPTVEFVTGALFVLYYVMYFIQHRGPCWMEMTSSWDGDRAHYYFVETIAQHWPQYFLAVFTISALLPAAMIDAKQFWIPQSIPMLMAAIGLLYHTILDRPHEPGSLNLQSGGAAAMTVGAGLGLLISLGLLAWGKLPRSFAEGWPELEIDKDPPPADAKEGRVAAMVRRWIDTYRSKLTPQQEQTLNQFKAQAAARDKQEADRRTAEQAEQPKVEAKEFTRADITREIRKEMVFLMPPLILGIAGFALVTFSHSTGASWERFLHQHHWISGFLGALLGGMVGGFVVWFWRILGSLVFGREAMGMGDVDLMFGVGTIIGAGAATVAFFVAPFFGIVLAIYMFVVGKRRELPFGPYLALGTAFVMIYYCPIAEYLRPGLTAMSNMLQHVQH
ncbi:MAG: peptidase family protein [Phycisphaerales bacterium]|nr:peptidase family protein [Phycisphaerales bacterium]